MVDFTESHSHNVVRLHQMSGLDSHAMPPMDEAPEDGMSFVQDLGRKDVLTVFTISGAVFAAFMISAVVTAAVLGL